MEGSETQVVTASAPEKYSRAITPSEWWRSAIVLRGLVQEIQICVEGDGVIDPSALTAAISTASQACPGARLVRRGHHWVDSGTAPVLKVVHAADFDRTRLDSPLLRAQLTCYRSSCEVVLVQGKPATVIFRAHPGVMDGQGVLLWQRQVFRALRGEALEGAASPLNRDMIMAEIATRLGIDLPPVQGPQPGPPWRSVLGKLPSGPRRSLWCRRTIDGAHTGVIGKIARLVTAYGDQDKDGLVAIPIELRGYLPDVRSTAGLGGLISIFVREADDWSDVDANLLTALDEHQFLALRGDATWPSTPQPVMRGMAQWMDNLARQNQDVIKEKKLAPFIASVSHLGTVELADFRADGFEATSCYRLGAVAYVPAFEVVECRGRTELTLAWRDGPGVRNRAEALLDWIEECLSRQAD